MPRFLPDLSHSGQGFKNRFSFAELYEAFVRLPRAIGVLAANRREHLLDRQAVERVMLAVTEVNGCPGCSWAHTRMALREGMTGQEISSMLSGSGEFVPPAEASGVLFAQHYADSRGHPDPETYDALVRASGPERARVVLAAAQVMLAGNIYGIPWSAFNSRLLGAPWVGSTVSYEIGMQLGGLLVLPVALAHGIVKSARR